MGSVCRASGSLRTATTHNACAAGTSTPVQSATPDPDVAVQKCEKSNNDGPCSGVAVQKGDNAPSRVDGDDQFGLSWRVIDQMTRDIEEYVWLRSNDGKGDTTEVQIEEEARRRIIDIGVSPEWIEVELDRVLSCLYDGREAQRSGGSHAAHAIRRRHPARRYSAQPARLSGGRCTNRRPSGRSATGRVETQQFRQYHVEKDS